MNKKTKLPKNETNQILKKVKSLMLDTIVREWLNTPFKAWNNKTPLQMIDSGEGQTLIDAIKLAGEEIKNEREDIRPKHVEETIEQETILSRIEGS